MPLSEVLLIAEWGVSEQAPLPLHYGCKLLLIPVPEIDLKEC